MFEIYIKIFHKSWNSPTLTTWTSFLSKSLQVIIVLPLVLQKFSVYDINLWYFVSAILSLQVVLDAGFGSAFVRSIAYTKNKTENIHSNSDKWNQSEQISIYRYMRHVYFKLFIFSFLSLLLFGTFLLEPIIQESSFPDYGWYMWGIVIVFFPIVIYGNIYLNLLQGIHQIPLLRRWDTLFNIANVLVSILIIFLFNNIYLLLVNNVVWLLLAVWRNKIIVFNYFLNKTEVETSNSEDLTMYKTKIVYPALKSGFGILASHGTIQLSGFVMNNWFDPNATSSYMLGITLINSLRYFAQAPFYSKIPHFSSLTKNYQMNQLRQDSNRSMKIVYFVFLTGFFFLAFFNEIIMDVIQSNGEFPSRELWLLLGLGFLIERYGGMHLQLYSTTNHIIWHTLNGITGISMIILTCIFIYLDFGITAFPLAMLISYSLIYSLSAAKKSYRFLNVDFFDFEKFTFIPALLSIVIYSIYVLLS